MESSLVRSAVLAIAGKAVLQQELVVQLGILLIVFVLAANHATRLVRQRVLNRRRGTVERGAAGRGVLAGQQELAGGVVHQERRLGKTIAGRMAGRVRARTQLLSRLVRR